MRFLIMRKHAAFVDRDGRDTELRDRQDGGLLLRILLLARADSHQAGQVRGESGRLVEKSAICREMPALRSSETTDVGDPISVGAVHGQKSHLTKLLGERSPGREWIATIGDAYRIDLPALEVDAFTFEHEIDSLGVRRMRDVWDAEPERLEDYKRLKSMWQANPAESFSLSEQEDLAFLYWHFQEAYERLRLAIVYALLQRGEHGDIGEAVSHLNAMSQASKEDTSDEVWRLLLRAQGSLPGYRDLVPGVLKYIETHVRTVPDELVQLAAAVLERDADLLFGSKNGASRERVALKESGIADSPNLDALERIALEVGISADGSSLRLQGGRTDPMECIDATNRRLYFSGVFATKWVDSRFKRSRLGMLLSRLDNELKPGERISRSDQDALVNEIHAPVRFLILDPESESCERYRRITGSAESPESLPWLKALVEEHSSFEVRMFDALPTFRIVILDDDVVSISPYKLSDYDHADGLAGWDAAHVALSPFAPWALARSFEALFLEQWRVARPIEELQ